MARALVLKPSVLLFDEPLSNLDARLRRQMREEIRELQQRLGLTVVYVTHDQQEAMAVSDRIIVMNAGRIEQQGTPRELYERPPRLSSSASWASPIPYAASCAASILSACAYGWGISTSTLTMRRGGRRSHDRRPPRSDYGRARASPMGSLAGTIAKASYLGTHMEYSIDTPAGPLFATCPRVDRPLGAGAEVGLILAARGVIIVRQ